MHILMRETALAVTRCMKIHGDAVTGNYFDLLGVQPQVGRFFHAADEHGPDSAPYVVLSDALWRSVFQADRGRRRRPPWSSTSIRLR